jgi:hypothetical protein
MAPNIAQNMDEGERTRHLGLIRREKALFVRGRPVDTSPRTWLSAIFGARWRSRLSRLRNSHIALGHVETPPTVAAAGKRKSGGA